MKKLIACLLFALALYGCASVKSNSLIPYEANNEAKLSIVINKKDGVDIPDSELEQIKYRIQEGLSQRGLLASRDEESHRTAEIIITSFRMRADSARLVVGMFAGCDNIKSNVTVLDNTRHQELGKAEIKIEECAAWGISDQVIGKYSKGVVAYLAGEK